MHVLLWAGFSFVFYLSDARAIVGGLFIRFYLSDARAIVGGFFICFYLSDARAIVGGFFIRFYLSDARAIVFVFGCQYECSQFVERLVSEMTFVLSVHLNLPSSDEVDNDVNSDDDV